MTEHEEKMHDDAQKADAADEETIHVTEEETHKEDEWEEFVVAGEELVNFVKKLVHETAVRRLVVKNEKRNIHLEIPLAMGVVSIALLPIYSSLALIAALVTECTILVKRVPEEKEPAAAE